MTIDNPEALLLKHLSAAVSARAVLSQSKGIEISGKDIQTALSEVLSINELDSMELVKRQLTSSEMVDLLKAYNFRKLHPEIIQELELEHSILPSGFPKLLTEETIKRKGEIWRVHKNDADPFPSNPHAHNYAAGVALHLGTGELFRKRQSAGKIKCKDLMKIRRLLSLEEKQLPTLDERCKK